MEDYKARGREALDGLVDRLVDTLEAYNYWDIEDDGMGPDDVRAYVLDSMDRDFDSVRKSVGLLAYELDGYDPEVDALSADLGIWAASREIASFDWENFTFELEDSYDGVSDFADEVYGRLLSDPQPVLDHLAGVPDHVADGRSLAVLGDAVAALPSDAGVDMSGWPDGARSAVRRACALSHTSPLDHPDYLRSKELFGEGYDFDSLFEDGTGVPGYVWEGTEPSSVDESADWGRYLMYDPTGDSGSYLGFVNFEDHTYHFADLSSGEFALPKAGDAEGLALFKERMGEAVEYDLAHRPDVGRVMAPSVPAPEGGERVGEPVHWDVPDADDGGGRSADDGWEFA